MVRQVQRASNKHVRWRKYMIIVSIFSDKIPADIDKVAYKKDLWGPHFARNNFLTRLYFLNRIGFIFWTQLYDQQFLSPFYSSQLWNAFYLDIVFTLIYISPNRHRLGINASWWAIYHFYFRYISKNIYSISCAKIFLILVDCCKERSKANIKPMQKYRISLFWYIL